jgi:predicted molibdopterin-dependent oxidoreductase YjgC
VETNRLTIAAFDPNSRQPAYKACAVQLEKVRKMSKRKTRAPLERSVESADYAD